MIGLFIFVFLTINKKKKLRTSSRTSENVENPISISSDEEAYSEMDSYELKLTRAANIRRQNYREMNQFCLKVKNNFEASINTLSCENCE